MCHTYASPTNNRGSEGCQRNLIKYKTKPTGIHNKVISRRQRKRNLKCTTYLARIKSSLYQIIKVAFKDRTYVYHLREERVQSWL